MREIFNSLETINSTKHVYQRYDDIHPGKYILIAHYSNLKAAAKKTILHLGVRSSDPDF